MNRRSIVALLALLALAGPDPTWAQVNGNGQGSENGNGNGASGGNGNSAGNNNAGGNENGNAGGNGNGNGGGNGNGDSAPAISNPAQQSGSDVTAGAGSVTVTPSSSPSGAAPSAPAASTELSERDVLAAVESGRAVALSTILPDVRSRTGGEVINAQLQQVRGFLLYAVTVLTPVGKVTTEYYYARSGQHVEP